MTTALEFTGLRITETVGVVYGLVVRSMGLTGSVGAAFKSLRRGEIHQYRRAPGLPCASMTLTVSGCLSD